MTNEQYLVVSYILVGIASLALGLGTYVLLRQSFLAITKLVPYEKFGLILRKLFLVGIVLPALVGFFSVSFKSCDHETYQQIIKERAYLIDKNQAQLRTSMKYICVALLLWGLFISIGLAAIDQRNKER